MEKELKLSEKVLYYMVKKDISLKQFCEIVGISQSFAYAILQDRKNPSKRMKIKIYLKTNQELVL